MNIVDWLKKEAELVALDRLLEAAAEIERLTAENERFRFALATVRDDLSSVTVTGEEMHNIIDGINDVLHQQQAVRSEPFAGLPEHLHPTTNK